MIDDLRDIVIRHCSVYVYRVAIHVALVMITKEKQTKY